MLIILHKREILGFFPTDIPVCDFQAIGDETVDARLLSHADVVADLARDDLARV